MLVLGIETSCDETAAALVEDGRHLRASVVASQAAHHARYGGIVPEVASRHHLEALLPVVRAALAEADRSWRHLDAVAVTYGPGLAGALLVGVNVAKAAAYAADVPLIPVNHLQAHVFANWLGEAPPPPTPALCLVVSGAHSDLALLGAEGGFRRLGRSRDDAAGEAFDKIARLLGLGFPGGPAIEAAARAAARRPPRLPRAWLRGSYDFSFSGLKTEVLRRVRGEKGDPPPVPELAAAVQEAIAEVLAEKAAHAARHLGARSLLLAGGVAANGRLRQLLVERSPAPVWAPPPALCTDNGAMVAACGYYRFQEGARAGLDLDVAPALPIDEP